MIINIRGTSGSGKSTIVRAVMETYRNGVGGVVHPVYDLDDQGVKIRKQPLYCLLRAEGLPNLTIIGHYETACGGCDTINRMEDIFDLVREAHSRGDNVLFEGLLISADMKRTMKLHLDGLPLHIIALDVPLDDCFAGIMARREAKASKSGKEPRPEGPNTRANLLSKWKGTKQAIKKMGDFGVACSELPRDEAKTEVFRLLGLGQ